MDTPTDIVPFSNAEFGQLRALNIEGEPWFVAADPCSALGHTNVSVALSRLDDDEKAKFNLGLPGGATNCVSFPGLLSLILGSRKPEAREYKRWVTHDVLPAIHTHGGYLTPQKVEEVLTDPDTIIRLATELKNERSRSRVLEESVSLLADEMVEKRSNRATAKAVDRGYLRNVAASYFDRDGERRLRDPYAVVTPKGLDWMARRYCPAPSQPALALDCGVM